MTWVKICGITREDALAAAHEGGADAVGLVIAASSPRAVTLEGARRLIARSELPAFLVSVDATPTEIERAVEQTGAAGVQPHGEHRADVVAMATQRGWKALYPIPVGGEAFTAPVDLPAGAIPILDTASGSQHGGTGVTFDWRLIDDALRPFVLAGGLGVDNVADAIRTVEPYGVDASSRLETVPGVKDPDTILAFIEEAKSA